MVVFNGFSFLMMWLCAFMEGFPNNLNAGPRIAVHGARCGLNNKSNSKSRVWTSQKEIFRVWTLDFSAQQPRCCTRTCEYIYIYRVYMCIYASSLVVTQHRLDHCLWPSNMQLNVCTVAVGKGPLNTILVTSSFAPRS